MKKCFFLPRRLLKFTAAVFVLVLFASLSLRLDLSSTELIKGGIWLLDKANLAAHSTSDTDQNVGDGDLSNSRSKREKLLLLMRHPEYQRRLSMVHDVCFNRPIGRVQKIIVDNERKSTSMCIVPKAGCTHWINIFRFINNETHGVDYKKPSDIPRWITHYGEQSSVYALADKNENNHLRIQATSFIGDTFRFMFVRDPYRRLWSAWIDKFLLPDFWFSDAPKVAKFLKLGPEETKCPVNITFNQFLRYITQGYFSKKSMTLNNHWAPYHLVCDPCIFRPHLIGKLETFETDSRMVLSIMNQTKLEDRDKVSNPNYRKDGGGDDKISYETDRAIHEMRMLTEYHFDGMWNSGDLKPQFKSCEISQLYIAQRLWKAFQYNGHIPEDEGLNMTSWNEDLWRESLSQAYSLWGDDPAYRRKQQKRQRDLYISRAFKQVPTGLLQRVQKLYRFDFQQFDYDKEPEEIFGTRFKSKS